jgi:two-component system sensor histidine kinase UhpB
VSEGVLRAAIAVVVICVGWSIRSMRRTSRADDQLSRMESERRISARRQMIEREEERAAISRELHDEIGQLLTAALLQLDQAEAHPGDPQPLAAAREATEAAFDEVRALSRRVQPLVAADLEPADALSAMAGSITHRAGSELVLDVDPVALEMLDQHQQLVAFRVARLALRSVVSENGSAPIRMRVFQQKHLVVLHVSWAHRGIPLTAEQSRQLRDWALAADADLEVSAPRGELVLKLRPLNNGARSPL